MESSRNRLVGSLRLARRRNDVLFLPLVVIEFHNDFLLAMPQCSKTIRSGWFLKHILVGLLALAGTPRTLGLIAVGLNLVASVLKHALQFDLFGLLAVNVVLELLNHAVGVLERVLEGLRFKLAMAWSSLAWRRWRRMFRGQTFSLVEALIRRVLLRRVVLVAPHAVGYSLCELLVLRGQIFHLALKGISLRLSHGHIASQTRQFRLVLLDLVDVVIVELCVHALELLELAFQGRFLRLCQVQSVI